MPSGNGKDEGLLPPPEDRVDGAELRPPHAVGDLVLKLQRKQLTHEDLSDHEKVMLVRFLLLEGMRPADIARLMGCVRKTVYNLKEKGIAEAQNELADLTVYKIAAQHLQRGEHIAAKLIRDGKDFQAWLVYRGMIADLQSLNVVAKAPARVEVAIANLPESETDAEREYQEIRDAEHWAVDGALPAGQESAEA